MEAADEGLWEWNLTTDEAVFDEVALGMLGYSPSDAQGPLKRGGWWMKQVHPEDQEERESSFQATLAGATPRYGAESRLRCKDGGYVWVASTGLAIVRDGSGRPEVMAGIHRDITERKQREEAQLPHRETLEQQVDDRTAELAKTQDTLFQQDKLATLGRMAGGVAHELRNPLGAIKNGVYFLKMALEEPEEEIRDTVAILEREVSDTERILQDLFDCADPKPPCLRKGIRLNDRIRDSLSRLHVPGDVEVITRLTEELPDVTGDPNQLDQVLSNLMRNAIQAMRQGGTLTVRSRILEDGRVEIAVSDTGEGIPEENRERIFEPLFTTKAKGIGLGLSLCRSHVEANGGTLHVESKERKGATFLMVLPGRRGA